MTYKELVKRNKQILKLRANRFKLKEIGEKFGITKERVRQIILVKGKVSPLLHPIHLHLQKYLTSVGKVTGREVAREMVRLRDKHTCQDCEKVLTTKKVCKYNKTLKTQKGKIKSLDVHHTKGQCGKNSLGYDSPKDISGMVTLCHKCHYNRPEHRAKSKEFSEVMKNAFLKRKSTIHRSA